MNNDKIRADIRKISHVNSNLDCHFYSRTNRSLYQTHGVQRRMISVDFFCIFEIIIFCFVVAIYVT